MHKFSIKILFVSMVLVFILQCKISYANDSYDAKFKNTIITPVIDTQIEPGKNLVYCSTFQMAWNEVCNKYADGTLEIADAPKYIEKLNALNKQPALLDENSFIAMSGLGGEGIINKVNEALEKKFGNSKTGEILPKINYSLGSNEILAFAYLYKNLEFENIFDTVEAILMNINNHSFHANAFGSEDIEENEKLKKQVNVIYYNNYETDEVEMPDGSVNKVKTNHMQTEEKDMPEGSIIRLLTKSDTDEIIISSLPISNTLIDTYQMIKEISERKLERRIPVNSILFSLKIPKLKFDILHNYKELKNKEVLNKSIKKYLDKCYVGEAIQKISFNLDQKGAQLSSHGSIICVGSVKRYYYRIIIKCPFIIYMKDKTKKFPYFMAYVDNNEVLEQYDPPEYNEFGKVDKEIALNPILKMLSDNWHTGDCGKSPFINYKNENGLTPLLLMIKKRSYIFLRIDKYANDYVNKITSRASKEEKNNFACQIYIGMIKMLIRNGADIDLCDNDGNSPLMYAIENADTQVVSLLIDFNADVFIKRKDNIDALTLAREKNNTEIIKLINSKIINKE